MTDLANFSTNFFLKCHFGLFLSSSSFTMLQPSPTPPHTNTTRATTSSLISMDSASNPKTTEIFSEFPSIVLSFTQKCSVPSVLFPSDENSCKYRELSRTYVIQLHSVQCYFILLTCFTSTVSSLPQYHLMLLLASHLSCMFSSGMTPSLFSTYLNPKCSWTRLNLSRLSEVYKPTWSHSFYYYSTWNQHLIPVTYCSILFHVVSNI